MTLIKKRQQLQINCGRTASSQKDDGTLACTVYRKSESSVYFIFCHLFHEINDITTTRSVVLQCLPLHLGDTSSEFFLSCSDADSASDSRQVPFGVLRVLTEATPPELGSIALILKRNIVIDEIPSTSQALCLLFSIWITPKSRDERPKRLKYLSVLATVRFLGRPGRFGRFWCERTDEGFQTLQPEVSGLQRSAQRLHSQIVAQLQHHPKSGEAL
ncbi:uncharacterized protein V6R79_022677 [Siganus canaliculatus]